MNGILRLFPWLLLTVAIVVATAWVGPSLAGERGDLILLKLRLPRALAGALVGAVLSAAGAVQRRRREGAASGSGRRGFSSAANIFKTKENIETKI